MDPNNLSSSGADNASGEGDDRSYVTKEELGNAVNAAVRDHMRRSENKMAKLLEDGFASLKESIESPNQTVDSSISSATGSEGEDKGKPNPELTAMKRQQTQLTNKLNSEIEARKAAEKREADNQLRARVSEQLGEFNITGSRLTAAMALLYQNGRVKIAEDGAHLFVDTNGDELPISEGLKTWAGSDEAKLFTPPREVKGSGDKGRGKVATFKGKDSGLNTLIEGGIEAAEFLITNQ